MSYPTPGHGFVILNASALVSLFLVSLIHSSLAFAYCSSECCIIPSSSPYTVCTSRETSSGIFISSGNTTSVRISIYSPYTAAEPLSMFSSSHLSTKHCAFFSLSGRFLLCLCNLPIRCSKRSIGQSSLIITSKSMSNDCSITCVPTTISLCGRLVPVPALPSCLRSISSFDILSVAVKRECSSDTSSPNSAFNLSASSCACFTVFTIMAAQPPSLSKSSSRSTTSFS